MKTTPSSASSFFFLQHEFIFRDAAAAVESFSGENGSSIHFTRKRDELISLSRSPFGGFVISDESKCEENVASLMSSFTSWASAHGIRKIIIRCMPECYDPVSLAIISETLMRHGFSVLYSDVTQFLSTENKLLTLAADRKRAFKKCVEAGFQFRQLGPSHLEEAYDLVVESRTSKDYPITMTLEELKDVFGKFPDRYLLFGVFNDKEMIATSVSISVNNDILYCFYLGDTVAYRSFSPVTFLVNEIHQFAIRNKFSIIDLGISTDKGVLNEGLYSFKKSFGSIDSPKLTFEKIL